MKNNKETLIKANKAVSSGDNEGFLSFCTENIEWIFEGDVSIRGKEDLRQWMADNYKEPPQFKVSNLIEEGEFVVAIGTLENKNKSGIVRQYSYCDVWQFESGKMAKLNAFVVEI